MCSKNLNSLLSFSYCISAEQLLHLQAKNMNQRKYQKNWWIMLKNLVLFSWACKLHYDTDFDVLNDIKIPTSMYFWKLSRKTT